MAGAFHRLIFLSAFSSSVLLAQDNNRAPSPAPTPVKTPGPALAKPPNGTVRPDLFEDARRIFEKLSPEERQRFRENVQRWKDMPPEEKAALRDRDQIRREKMAQEIDESLRKAGLQLDPDRREVYALRYSQERRKIEEKIRKEVDQKRAAMMQEALARLKAEFTGFSSPAQTGAPSATPK